MNEYQIVGFVPIDSIELGRLFILENELALIYSSQNDASTYDELRKYDLSNPINPELNDEIKLSKTLPEPLLYQYNKFLIFSKADLIIIKVLDIYNGNVYEVNLGFQPLAIASKDSFMFILADSCLTGWNIADFSNPVMIYQDSIPTCFTGGLLAISDTLMFGILNNDSFKLWNIKLPSQPRLISSGALEYKMPIKVIINDRNIYIAHNFAWARFFISHLTIDDSGKVSLRESKDVDNIDDFLVNRDTIYILTHQIGYYVYKYRFLVGDAINFPDFWTEVPLPELVFSPNFTIHNNYIYFFARKKGVFIYQRKEEQ